MKKFSRAALMRKKHWSGEDVGRAYIYGLAIQAPGDKEAEPIDGALLRSKAAALDSVEFSIYRSYMQFYNWLICEFSLAQATIFHAKSAALEAATMLLEAREADVQRSRLMKSPVCVDSGEVATAIQNALNKIMNPVGALMFSGEELANLALLNASIKIMPRDYYMTAHSLIHPETRILAETQEIRELAEQQAQSILIFGQSLAALLKEHKGENHLDEFDTGLLYEAVHNKLTRESPKITAPLTIERLEWYQDYKRAVLSLPGIESINYSFSVLYTLDFEGLFLLARNAFNPIFKIPRYNAAKDPLISCPPGTSTILETPNKDGCVNVKIEPDGTATDLLANGEIVADLTEKGIYKYTGKGKSGTEPRDTFAALMDSISADIDATHKFNLLIDLAAERVGVEEIKRYKRDFSQIQLGAAKYNLALQEYREQLEFTGETQTMKYTFDDLEKRTAAIDVVYNFMQPISLTECTEFPESTINRIKAAFEDLNIFGGASSKIYALFNEGGDD